MTELNEHNIVKFKLLIPIVILIFGCNSAPENKNTGGSDCQKLEIKEEILSVIKQSKNCNKRKDIDCFMSSFDSSFILESNESADKNRTIVKDTLKKDILRDWSIIAKMYEVEQWIDSIYVLSKDTAIVFTNQFYHRTFTKPNNLPGEDDIVSTQKHRETWIKRKDGWKQSRVKELGGTIYINGQPYNGE